jgi:outer membrane protein assembly factor BamE (lipoprotein component of BamABCDE complex)
MKPFTRFLSLWLLISLGIGASFSCVNLRSERGVENLWGSNSTDGKSANLQKGKTTKSKILDDLGPPSQVLAIGDETVFYYLREQINGRGVILLVYNNVNVHTDYDRAIFFFDQRGVLKDFAVSEAQ